MAAMFSFQKLLKVVLVAVSCSSASLAAPRPTHVKHETHRIHLVGRGDSALQIESFAPASQFETYGIDGVDHPLAKRDDFDLQSAAKAFVVSKLDVSADDVHYNTGYSADVTHHAFIKQQTNGVPFANAVANVAFNKNGKVTSFGSSFVDTSDIASSTPSVSAEDAIKTAETALGASAADHPTSLEYLALSDGSAALMHVVRVQDDDKGIAVDAYVDAHTNKLVSIVNFVTNLTYRVLPIQEEILTQGFQDLNDPENAAASPLGWVTDNTTAGNNAISYKNGAVAEETSTGSFIYTVDPSQDPTIDENLNAAIVNAFYVVNTVHDISYLYGFTETAFNFQNDNLGKGGKGGDRVMISVQDSLGTDNAAFTTFPEGMSGIMRMFLWDLTYPERDGALENDIVSHEATHGITNRMTGGGTASCLQATEAGGMGEGWSDAMADWLENDSKISDFIMGQYVTNMPTGYRTYPYSRSATTNPLDYASLQTLTEVHNIGEIWANILHNVLAALVDAHGFSTTAKTDASGNEGNVVFMHLMLDALPLQPCNPTFLTARDAIIQADANRYAGANKCTLWKTFASRGLGVNAADHVNDATVPADC
ncbi:hypothetical protein PENSPDRAFT_642738 [Peniophora sp. CONT]|nr:hypothetical protein PENSPDRAFT_642738 [Peniophora sp. CONT]